MGFTYLLGMPFVFLFFPENVNSLAGKDVRFFHWKDAWPILGTQSISVESMNEKSFLSILEGPCGP